MFFRDKRKKKLRRVLHKALNRSACSLFFVQGIIILCTEGKGKAFFTFWGDKHLKIEKVYECNLFYTVSY